MPASRLRTLRPPRRASLASLRSSPTARRSAALLGGIGLVTALAAMGDLLSPLLRDRYPLVLMLLTPRTPYLVAAAGDLPFAVFLLGALARLCVADPLHFQLGRTTGPAGVAAAGKLASRGQTGPVRSLGQFVSRRTPSSASSRLWLVGVAATPTAKAMVLTGAAGVRARSVALANVAGTFLRVMVIWHAGRSFPVLAQTCAAVVPWVVIPTGTLGVAVAAVRWHRRRALARAQDANDPRHEDLTTAIPDAEPALPATGHEPANPHGGCHSWVTPQPAVVGVDMTAA